MNNVITNSSELFQHAIYFLSNIPEFMNYPIQNHPSSSKLAVILDTRYDALMEIVIKNIMYYTNQEGWNLCIISASEYESKIKQTFPNALVINIDPKYIVYSDYETASDSIYASTPIPNISIDSYNEILLSKEFWQTFPDHVTEILIFQKDCILFHTIPPIFSHYDYVGASYIMDDSPVYGGVNGGFSYRKKQAMISCLEKVTWDIIIKYRNSFPTLTEIHMNPLHQKNEDVFYTHACEILRYNVPDRISRTFFAVESDFNKDAAALHGWDKNYLSIEYAIQLLNSSDLFSIFMKKVQLQIDSSEDIFSIAQPNLQHQHQHQQSNSKFIPNKKDVKLDD